MNTPNPTKQAAAANKSSKTKDANNEASESMEMLKQAIGFLKPLSDFHKVDEAMTQNDVRMYWDIRVVRGQDQHFAHLQGTSTFNNLFAYNMRMGATSMIEHEINEKVTMPLVAKLQEEIERTTFEDLAARKQATEAEADDEEDEDAWAENPAMP